MNKDKLNTTDLRNKILKGINLAVERLIRKKQKEDGELVFSQNGQILVVNAKGLATE